MSENRCRGRSHITGSTSRSTFSRRCCATEPAPSCSRVRAQLKASPIVYRSQRMHHSDPYGAPSSRASTSSGRRAICDFNFFIELFHNLVARPHSHLIHIQFRFVSDKEELLLLASFAEANRCPESFG